jgi:hypothetical protein
MSVSTCHFDPAEAEALAGHLDDSGELGKFPSPSLVSLSPVDARDGIYSSAAVSLTAFHHGAHYRRAEGRVKGFAAIFQPRFL